MFTTCDRHYLSARTRYLGTRYGSTGPSAAASPQIIITVVDPAFLVDLTPGHLGGRSDARILGREKLSKLP